ncbi:hypothetical protein PanWU01x14_015720, partial [Parasponia andersonii]
GKESEKLVTTPFPNKKAIQHLMAPSRMTTRSTRPEAEGSSRDEQPDLGQKLDQMLAALAEANRKAEMAHEAILGLRDEVAEVRRDNACLEGLLASEDRTSGGKISTKKSNKSSEANRGERLPPRPGHECRGYSKASQDLSKLGGQWAEDTMRALGVRPPTRSKR